MSFQSTPSNYEGDYVQWDNKFYRFPSSGYSTSSNHYSTSVGGLDEVKSLLLYTFITLCFAIFVYIIYCLSCKKSKKDRTTRSTYPHSLVPNTKAAIFVAKSGDDNDSPPPSYEECQRFYTIV